MPDLSFSDSHVVVVGDLMLDRYWFGDSVRLSPEAPIPVVHVQRTVEVPGGAGNVAMNAAGLGARTALLSVVGDDPDGQCLQKLLAAAGIDCVLLLDPSIPTTLKLRVISRHQQVVRVDFEKAPDHELLLPVVAKFSNILNDQSVVIFADYGKGGLIHLKQMMRLTKQRQCRVIIDPKGSDYSAYAGATLITPNRDEFRMVAGSWSSEAELERKAFELQERLHLQALLITRSEEGMSLFTDGAHIRILTKAQSVVDVSGAGDTVTATIATALGAGYGLEDAVRLANAAAGVVVSKVGTTPISLVELQACV